MRKNTINKIKVNLSFAFSLANSVHFQNYLSGTLIEVVLNICNIPGTRLGALDIFFHSIFSIPSSKFCKTGFNTSIIPVRKPRIQKFKRVGEGRNATKRQAELTPRLSDLNEAGPQSSPHK